MRRFFAMLLALLTVATLFSALPIAATDTEFAKSDFDNSRSNQEMDGLIITEMLINSKTGVEGLDDQLSGQSAAVFKSPDAMDYIEVYNAGSLPVNMYDYCILSANYRKFIGDDTTDANSVKYQFTHKNEIKQGSIHNGASSDSKIAGVNEVENKVDGTINPGEFAIIWFWTDATDTASRQRGNLAGSIKGDSRDFPYFRDHYDMDSKTKIFVTNAKKSGGQKDIYNSLETNWIYALAEKDCDAGMIAIQGSGDAKYLDTGIKCMASYTSYNSVGIVTTDNMDNVSAYYVPSYCTPDLVNEGAKKAAETNQTTYTAKANYVEANCALSFKETAIISFNQDPTPGGMPSWQWQYIEPDSNTNHNPDDIHVENRTYGYGLEFIDQQAWKRVEAKLEELLDPANNNKDVAGITGAPNQLVGNSAMTEELRAAKKLELYDQLMDCCVSDWLDQYGEAENAALRVAEGERAGRLIVSKTGEGDAAVYDWIAKADAYMKENFTPTVDQTGNSGYQEDKGDNSSGFVEGGNSGNNGNTTNSDSNTASGNTTTSGSSSAQANTDQKDHEDDKNDGLSGGMIALIVIGSVLGVVLIVGAVLLILFVKARERDEASGNVRIKEKKEKPIEETDTFEDMS